MASRKATEPIPVPDSLPITLELMRALATSVFNEHADEAGLCVMCGSAWPCEHVVLLTNSLSVTEQLDFSYKLIATTGRIRTRVEKAQSIDGDTP